MQRPLIGGDDSFRCRSKTLNPFSSGIPLFKKDVKGHFGCVNSVEFSNSENLVASGGDDSRVFIWSVSDLLLDELPKPVTIMDGTHHANVFAHAFNYGDQILFSGGNDGRVLMHDIETGNTARDWNGSGAVYNIACSPVDDHVFSAARESGIVVFYDTRARDDEKPHIIKCKRNMSSMYSGQFNPVVPHLFAVASDKEGLAIYDTRSLKTKYLDLSRFTKMGAMYAEWNSMGTGLAVNQQHKNPLYVDLVNNRVVNLKDKKFENFHTVKSITFGEDDWILGGSDDFNVYGWQIPKLPDATVVDGSELREVVHTASIFRGHRSIVNHVRYSKQNKMMMSCGVEKIIKLWSPFCMPGSSLKHCARKLGAEWNLNSDESGGDGDDCMEEDIHMLEYFDRLVLSTRGRARLGIVSDSEMSDLSGQEGDNSGSGPLFMASAAFYPMSDSPSDSDGLISDLDEAISLVSDSDRESINSEEEQIDEWPPRVTSANNRDEDQGSTDSADAVSNDNRNEEYQD